jgi:hypothetical protein
MAAGQMVSKKRVNVGRANLSWRNLSACKPASEVRRDSAIQANRTDGVTPTAKIAGVGVGNYVKLAARTRITSTGIMTKLLVHSET